MLAPSPRYADRPAQRADGGSGDEGRCLDGCKHIARWWQRIVLDLQLLRNHLSH
jgi:hypothetical protein